MKDNRKKGLTLIIIFTFLISLILSILTIFSKNEKFKNNLNWPIISIDELNYSIDNYDGHINKEYFEFLFKNNFNKFNLNKLKFYFNYDNYISVKVINKDFKTKKKLIEKDYFFNVVL